VSELWMMNVSFALSHLRVPWPFTSPALILSCYRILPWQTVHCFDIDLLSLKVLEHPHPLLSSSTLSPNIRVSLFLFYRCMNRACIMRITELQ
jgi:hypothetical protein